MERRSRLIGLLFFVVLVAAVQVLENTYRWYVHREDRVHLTLLREELIDAGAEMIEAQLAMNRIRDQIQAIDEAARPRGPQFVAVYRGVGVSPPHGQARPAAARVDLRAQIAERNRRLDELNDVVARRNSAAIRYHLLADSIRTIAQRVHDPYFAVPLPAEAATSRGVGAAPAVGVAQHGSTAQRGLLHGATPRVAREE